MKPLTVERLDQLAALEFAGDARNSAELIATEFCAYAEWYWLRSAGRRLGRLVRPRPFSELHDRLQSGTVYWTTPSPPARGFIRVRRQHTDYEDTSWVAFRYELQRAVINDGFSETWAKEIVGAIGELEDNIHVHSEAVGTGLLAYWLEEATLEFVVLDRGIGVLRSLTKAAEHRQLSDHGTALWSAVQDGTSRYGADAGRGWGFHDLFKGLANSNARMRFRSGDHLLTVDGRDGLPAASLAQSAATDGLLISVRVSSTRD